MWTRNKLMRALPDIRVVVYPGEPPLTAWVWEATQTTATLRYITGTKLFEATVPIMDVVRGLNRPTYALYGLVVTTAWEQV